MKKVKHFLLLIILFLFSCTGPIGPTGLPGSEGANVPGGIISFYIDDNSGAADMAVMIAFDPDEFVASGNEIIIEVPFADYMTGNDVAHSVTWRALGVPLGEYYVYAWFDLDGGRDFDSGTPESTYIFIYDIDGAFSYTEAPDRITTSETLEPNYVISENYAADIFIEWSF